MPGRQRVADEELENPSDTPRLFERIVDEIAQNAARYLEKRMGLS